jgi:hypothetical protein
LTFVIDMPNFRAAWEDRTARLLDPNDGLPVVVHRLDNGGLEADWERTFSPASAIEDLLNDATEVAIGNFEHAYVRQLLAWCVHLGRKADHDPRWQTTWSRGLVELQRGRAFSDAALAEAWLSNAAPDRNRLGRAGAEIARGAMAHKGYWAEPEQSDYLQGVQCVLIAGDIAAARSLLRVRRSFTRVQAYFDWFSTFVDRIPEAQADASPSVESQQQFDAFFDVARDPLWAPPLHGNNAGLNVGGNRIHLRLRLALLRWRYIECRDITGYWPEIIAQIGR